MAITIMCVCVCTRNNVNWNKDVTLEIGRRKLILKSHSKSAAQIFEKLDRRFPHGAGRLDSNWLEDEASAQLGVLGDCPDFSSVGDGSSGERGSY